MEGALKGRRWVDEVTWNRPLCPAPTWAAAARISAPPGVGSCVQPAAPWGRDPRDLMVGAARRLLGPAGRPGKAPCCAGRGSNLFQGGVPGCPGDWHGPRRIKGLGLSIKMNFLKQFPASKLKCNPSFNSGREGSERAGNGMTFFPWVDRPTAKFFHCVVYVPHLAFKRLEIIWIWHPPFRACWVTEYSLCQNDSVHRTWARRSWVLVSDQNLGTYPVLIGQARIGKAGCCETGWPGIGGFKHLEPLGKVDATTGCSLDWFFF